MMIVTVGRTREELAVVLVVVVPARAAAHVRDDVGLPRGARSKNLNVVIVSV